MSDPAIDLDALVATLAAATPGPWDHHPADPHYIIGAVGEGEDGPEWLDVGDTGGRPPGYPGSATADAAAIVAAVNAAPALIAELRDLRAKHGPRQCVSIEDAERVLAAVGRDGQ